MGHLHAMEVPSYDLADEDQVEEVVAAVEGSGLEAGGCGELGDA